MTANKLPLTYRYSEIHDEIAPCLRAGDSCSVVGVSGMAKSNLFRHLLNPDVRQHFLGASWRDYLFLESDMNALGSISEQAVYSLLISRLMTEAARREVSKDVLARIKKLKAATTAGLKSLSLNSAFTQIVETLMLSLPAAHLVFLFDQFDEVYKTLPPYFFSGLRAIRDEHKYRISYLLFTREELPYLCRAPECEEFYELFLSNIIGLGPYNREDSLTLVNRVCSRYERRLSEVEVETLIALSGGHPGILKAACMSLLRNLLGLPKNQDKAIETLLSGENIRAECEKIWESIHSEEQLALSLLMQERPVPRHDSETMRRLRLKCLIDDSGANIRFISPLLMAYVSELKVTAARATKIQAGPIRIDTSGEVWVNEQLIMPSLTKKELLLLEHLCLSPARLMTKDEIIATVYSYEYNTGGSVSDEAINALVRRLRGRIELLSGGECQITTVRGKGYRLDVTFGA